MYRELLGETFDRLPLVLRRFHGQDAGGSACLVFRVTHGNGWLCRMAAKIARLPRPGDEARGSLHVVIDGDCERWIREVDGRRIETVQHRRDGLLIEETGPLHLGFRVMGSAEGMRFESVGGWFCGLPLASPLTPRVTAIVIGHEESWRVDVRVELPVVGLLIRYEGEVTPE